MFWKFPKHIFLLLLFKWFSFQASDNGTPLKVEIESVEGEDLLDLTGVFRHLLRNFGMIC